MMVIGQTQKNNDNRQIPIRQLEMQPHFHGYMDKENDAP